MNYEQYLKQYQNLPLSKRIIHRILWIMDSLWSAINGRAGPGERMLCSLIKEMEKEFQDLSAMIGCKTGCKRCGKPKKDWQVFCGAACSAQYEAGK